MADSCKKIGYLTRSEAMQNLRMVKNHGGAAKRFYQCKCTLWHLTSMSKREQKAHKRKQQE